MVSDPARADSAPDSRQEAATDGVAGEDPDYRVSDQVGHLLRRAHQRASAVFQDTLADPSVTPMQFAALMTLHEEGPLSQNHLGRLAAMDPATVQGVIRRLEERGVVERRADPDDRRRAVLTLNADGRTLAETLRPSAAEVSRRTLEPLSPEERETLLRLLRRVG